MTDLIAVVLAAGLGKRMKSSVPKVLHQVAGRPIVYYPVRACLEAGAHRVVVVVGHGRDAVTEYLTNAFGSRVAFALQDPPRGTGDAVRRALEQIGDHSALALIACGDTPLLTSEDLRALPETLRTTSGSDLAMLTCTVDDPHGYGRVLRDAAGHVIGVREQRDLRTPSEQALREVNPGVFCARMEFLRRAVGNLRADNAQNEFYLTDIVSIAAAEKPVVGLPGSPLNLAGINDRAQLAQAEALLRRRIADAWRLQGATIDHTAVLDDTVKVECDAVIGPFVVLRGETHVAPGGVVEAGSVLTDAVIGTAAHVKPYCVITSSTVGSRAQIGPFAHLRPESDIGEEAHVGNFVETKKTQMMARSKANHLAYLGDGQVGEGANIGAGTIFCNYDGFQKHRTVIGRGAFIGSDSQLVAPVTVGDNAYVGTGSTVTMDVPADALAIGRARQENKLGYATRLRSRLAAAKAAAKGSATK